MKMLTDHNPALRGRRIVIRLKRRSRTIFRGVSMWDSTPTRTKIRLSVYSVYSVVYFWRRWTSRARL